MSEVHSLHQRVSNHVAKNRCTDHMTGINMQRGSASHNYLGREAVDHKDHAPRSSAADTIRGIAL
jgi:hypothetical protein